MDNREAFLSTMWADPMPTDSQNCSVTWRSDRVWVTFGDTWWRGQDGDSHASWDGLHCGWPGNLVTPPPPNDPPPGGGILWFTEAGAGNSPYYMWLSEYQAIYDITQPMYAYWAMKAKTYLYLT